jgi:DNA-binding MarR family transcriptional regulator
MLYPILSHDKLEVEYRFVDKSAKGPLRTVKVKVRGWPACIFCTLDRKYTEELSTRSFTVTPEISREKISEANRLITYKSAFPWEYAEETEEAKIIKGLIESLKRQLIDAKTDVVIPFANLHELFPKEITRDMRDFQHFCQFLKTITVLHFYQRSIIKVGDKRFLVSTVEDVSRALEIYSEFFLTTRTGTEERILMLYHEVVKTKEAWYIQELTAKINEASVKKVSSDWVRKVLLQRLMDIGYVTVEADSEDKRLNVYKPLVKEEKELEEIRRFLDSPQILSSKLEEGFKKWLENIRGKEGLEIKQKIFAYKTLDEVKGTWGEAEISEEEFENVILGKKVEPIIEPKVSREGSASEIFSSISEQGFPLIFFKPNEGSDSEKKSEISGETVFRQSSANSVFTEQLFKCPYCEAKGQRVFFATKTDLEQHLQKVHGVW